MGALYYLLKCLGPSDAAHTITIRSRLIAILIPSLARKYDCVAQPIA